MAPRDFNSALAEATRDLGATMPDQVSRRLRARVWRGPGGRRVRWDRVGAVVAMLAAGGVVSFSSSAEPPTEPRAVQATVTLPAVLPALEQQPVLGGFVISQSSAEFAARADTGWLTVSAGQAALQDEGLGSLLELAAPARLRHLSDGVELSAGAVTLEVSPPRVGASPYRVRVSHGTLEVLGARFTVSQRRGSGKATLHRGSLRFRADDGRVRTLSAGQTLSWPLAAATTTRPLAPLAQADTEGLLERIAVLRSRGRYEEAVGLLAGVATTDERLSFELGSILTRQLHDVPRACEHWAAHRARFERGRYEPDVVRAVAALGCVK